ncbi:hypothetical protein AM593_06410, partial [Mytilus galloprovincialis]
MTRNEYDRDEPTTTTELQAPDQGQVHKECGGVKQVSVGANWKTVLEHIKIYHRRYHLGGFHKMISVRYLNNQEDRNMIGPQNETGNSPAQVTLRYEQIDSTPLVFVEEATQNPNPRFDAFEIADILKKHNIFIDRDLVRLRQDIGQEVLTLFIGNS